MTMMSVATPSMMPMKEKPAMTEMKPSLRRGAQIAQRHHPFEGRERPRALLCAHAASLLASVADCDEAIQGGFEGKTMAGAGGALFQLDLARGKALGPDDDLPGQPDQVHGGEFGPCPVVAVVVKHAQARRLKLAVELLAGRVGRGIADLEVDQADIERAPPIAAR